MAVNINVIIRLSVAWEGEPRGLIRNSWVLSDSCVQCGPADETTDYTDRGKTAEARRQNTHTVSQ